MSIQNKPRDRQLDILHKSWLTLLCFTHLNKNRFHLPLKTWALYLFIFFLITLNYNMKYVSKKNLMRLEKHFKDRNILFILIKYMVRISRNRISLHKWNNVFQLNFFCAKCYFIDYIIYVYLKYRFNNFASYNFSCWIEIS